MIDFQCISRIKLISTIFFCSLLIYLYLCMRSLGLRIKMHFFSDLFGSFV